MARMISRVLLYCNTECAVEVSNSHEGDVDPIIDLRKVIIARVNEAYDVVVNSFTFGPIKQCGYTQQGGLSGFT